MAMGVARRPFGFLVLDPFVDSGICRTFRDSGFDEGNPKGLMLVSLFDSGALLCYKATH